MERSSGNHNTKSIMRDYNKIVFYDLPLQIKTDYALFIQYDGFVLNGDYSLSSFLIGTILVPHGHILESIMLVMGFFVKVKS